jgi:hypothetical protein|tara:strand:- start:200 stop:301 length:102 start_codon:yes stop_codon:yes gene_type:complete
MIQVLVLLCVFLMALRELIDKINQKGVVNGKDE